MIKYGYQFLVVTSIITIGIMKTVSAEGNYLVNGVINGLNSFTTGIAIALPIAAALAIGYQQLMKMFDEEDMTPIRNKRTKSILKAAIIGETASAFVALVTSFFK